MNTHLTSSELERLQGNLISDLFGFLPELLICLGIILMLIRRLFRGSQKRHIGNFALCFAILALLVSISQWLVTIKLPWMEKGIPVAMDRSPLELFSGMLIYDSMTIFLRIFLYSFAILVIWLTRLTGIPDSESSADFYCLLLGAVLGMALMVASNHLLMVFIAIEMASLPSYALAGFLKGRRQSSEAALKYVVYGGGAAGVMLYGISLLAGKFGTGYLPDLAWAFRETLTLSGPLQMDPILILGCLFILIGFAFKLAAVPFHFWCPDVFEGAAAEVGGFLSVASKAAALALLARIALLLGGVPSETGVALQYIVPALAVFAIITATFGNLAAYKQTNLKRLLAYSTIAHAGYMMMGLAVVNSEGTRAVLFYLVAYLFMNLGAFAIVAFLRNLTGTEDLSGYRGLIRRAPWMVITLSVFLLSLLGIPPLFGFVAKFQIFAALVNGARDFSAANQPTLSTILWTTLVFGAINSVISAVYYIKVMKVMILETTLDDVEGTEPTPLKAPTFATVYAALLAFCILLGGLWWGPIAKASQSVVDRWVVAKAPPGSDQLPGNPAIPGGGPGGGPGGPGPLGGGPGGGPGGGGPGGRPPGIGPGGGRGGRPPGGRPGGGGRPGRRERRGGRVGETIN